MGIVLDLLLLSLVATAGLWLWRPAFLRATAGGRSPAWQWAQPPLGRAIERARGLYPFLARQAGFAPERFLWGFWIAKGFLALALPFVLLEMWTFAGGRLPLPWLIPPALVGFVLPDLWLVSARRARKNQITRALSYFVDLLVAFLYTGMSLESAFLRAARQGLDPRHPLAREVALTGRELAAGREPAEAFDDLARRTGVGDLRGLAAAVQMGIRVGTPLHATLEAQAEMLWVKRRERALQQIHAAAIKVMFPVMLCGFPLFFLLTFFPAILELLDGLTSITDLLR